LIDGFDQFELDFFNPWTGTCEDGIAGDRYTVTRAPARLTWATCDFQKRPSEHAAGSRELSAAELDSIVQVLAQVRASSEPWCGQDFPKMSLDVTSGATVDLYADDGDCVKVRTDGRSLVRGLVELSGTIIPLTR